MGGESQWTEATFLINLNSSLQNPIQPYLKQRSIRSDKEYSSMVVVFGLLIVFICGILFDEWILPIISSEPIVHNNFQMPMKLNDSGTPKEHFFPTFDFEGYKYAIIVKAKANSFTINQLIHKQWSENQHVKGRATFAYLGIPSQEECDYFNTSNAKLLTFQSEDSCPMQMMGRIYEEMGKHIHSNPPDFYVILDADTVVHWDRVLKLMKRFHGRNRVHAGYMKGREDSAFCDGPFRLISSDVIREVGPWLGHKFLQTQERLKSDWRFSNYTGLYCEGFLTCKLRQPGWGGKLDYSQYEVEHCSVFHAFKSVDSYELMSQWVFEGVKPEHYDDVISGKGIVKESDKVFTSEEPAYATPKENEHLGNLRDFDFE